MRPLLATPPAGAGETATAVKFRDLSVGQKLVRIIDSGSVYERGGDGKIRRALGATALQNAQSFGLHLGALIGEILANELAPGGVPVGTTFAVLEGAAAVTRSFGLGMKQNAYEAGQHGALMVLGGALTFNQGGNDWVAMGDAINAFMIACAGVSASGKDLLDIVVAGLQKLGRAPEGQREAASLPAAPL